jgi:dTDP-4-dehydrorhamnose reductase
MEVPWSYAVVDTSDSAALEEVLTGCDAVIHAAIANAFHLLDSQAAYSAYPGLTQAVTQASLAVGAQPIYISSDWVMDGATPKAPETHYGRPINTYGFLKALGEQVIRDLAPENGVIVRIGGVMGSHRLLEDLPRNQDVGFGYFVSALVKTLRAGQEFMVFGGEGVNKVATPSLASEIGATIHRIIDRGASGVFHAVADDSITREGLASLTCDVFDLDSSLVTSGEPPEADRMTEPVPIDTSLDNARVKSELGVGPISVRDLVEALAAEADGKLHPVTPLR